MSALRELLLAKDPPDLDEIREILADIRKDDERAGEIIAHLRGFLRKDVAPVREVDINQTIADVLQIVEPEAAKRGIAIDCDRLAAAIVRSRRPRASATGAAESGAQRNGRQKDGRATGGWSFRRLR